MCRLNIDIFLVAEVTELLGISWVEVTQQALVRRWAAGTWGGAEPGFLSTVYPELRKVQVKW